MNQESTLKRHPVSRQQNLLTAQKIVNDAIQQNIPEGKIRDANDEQIKKLLINIVLNAMEFQVIDGGEL